MPKMIICDKIADSPEIGTIVIYPEDYFPTLDAAVEGTYVVAVDGCTWGVEVWNVKKYPNWEFLRVVTPETNESSLACLGDAGDGAVNFNAVEVGYETPTVEEVPPAIEDFKPEEPTPIPEVRGQATDVVIFDDAEYEAKPIDVFGTADPRDYVRKEPEPKKVLILVEEHLASKLRGTLFTKTGKSFCTAGRNPLVIQADELTDVIKSSKPIGCIKVPTSRLDEWDAPDIMDDFLLVVFAEDEIPLPSCEGDANYFSFQPKDLKDLAPLYAFLSLEM